MGWVLRKFLTPAVVCHRMSRPARGAQSRRVAPAVPPHYTPDGSRFWTGTRWIPADQVQSPAPEPEPAPSPSAPARSRWRPWLAAAVAALLFASVSAGLAGTRPGRRGGAPPQRVAVPPAESILNLPFTDEVGSAAVQGTLIRDGVTDTVTGVLDFAPGRALHVTLYSGATDVGEFLDCAGIGYQLQEPGGLWVATPQVSRIDGALGWAGGPPPPGLRVAGWGAATGETAWHLASSSGAQWWIGARTGHPLRFSYRSPGWKLALTFDAFNLQPALTVPPPSSISTQAVQGAPGAVVTAPGLAVEIEAVDPAPRGLPAPPTGYLYKALFLSYQNNGSEPIGFDNNSFTLTDAYGAVYQEAPGVQMAPALPRHESLQPGQAASGWDVFAVARASYELTLRVGSPPGRQNVDFLVTIPLS